MTSFIKMMVAVLSWIIPSSHLGCSLLKYLDALEQDKATEADLEGKKYAFILEKQYRWESWADPKNSKVSLATTSPKRVMICWMSSSQKLFPHLKGFKQRASSPDTIEYKIGEIFGELKNRIASGYNLRDVVGIFDTLKFRSEKESTSYHHFTKTRLNAWAA